MLFVRVVMSGPHVHLADPSVGCLTRYLLGETETCVKRYRL